MSYKRILPVFYIIIANERYLTSNVTLVSLAFFPFLIFC